MAEFWWFRLVLVYPLRKLCRIGIAGPQPALMNCRVDRPAFGLGERDCQRVLANSGCRDRLGGMEVRRSEGMLRIMVCARRQRRW